MLRKLKETIRNFWLRFLSVLVLDQFEREREGQEEKAIKESKGRKKTSKGKQGEGGMNNFNGKIF